MRRALLDFLGRFLACAGAYIVVNLYWAQILAAVAQLGDLTAVCLGALGR
jgi:hypothetical protein